LEALGDLIGGKDEPVHLLVKPHPREAAEPLARSVAGFAAPRLSARLPEGGNALDLIAVADVVVGILSMVLLEASLAGKPVISVQVGHPRIDRWWGGCGQSVRVATSAEGLRGVLVDALRSRRPGPPMPCRFQGATEVVLGALEDLLKERRGSRAVPAAPL
jgi:hypothetical protein